MTTPSQQLSRLGVTLPDVAAPVASYAPAVLGGDVVATSGQLPFVDGALAATGKVGEGDHLVSPQQAGEAARVAALNALAAAAEVAGGIDRIDSIVKVTVYVASDPAFTGQPAVANGASDIITSIFGSPHARAAVGVAVLPLDAPVEVDLTAQIRR